MGNCCVNEKQLMNIQKFNVQRRQSTENKSIISSMNYYSKSKRTSMFIYNNEDIETNYIFSKEIGKGYFGRVVIAIPKNDKHKKFACKSINKSRLSSSKVNNLLREIETLSLVDHPNIVKFYETYNDFIYFHIIMELCTGGDLFTHVSQMKNITEQEICHLIYKITSAIVHCHSLGIVHRDLKPDNILFESKTQFSDIKLIDFGLSRKYIKEDDLHSVVGSPHYVAPEVLNGEYDEKCDVWSIGIITYCLLCGSPPFVSNDREEVFYKIQNETLHFNHSKYEFVSKEAKEFIVKALQKNPKKRPTAQGLLRDKWLEREFKDEINPNKVDVDMLNKLNDFHKPVRFIQKVFELIIKTMPNEELIKFKTMFNALDKKKIGLISEDDIMEALNEYKITIQADAIRKVGTKRYSKYLTNKNSENKLMINFTSFIAAVIDKKMMYNKSRLLEVFNMFDTDKSGHITIFSLQKLFERTGKKKPFEEIKEMYEELGLDETQELDFDTFCQIISNENEKETEKA